MSPMQLRNKARSRSRSPVPERSAAAPAALHAPAAAAPALPSVASAAAPLPAATAAAKAARGPAAAGVHKAATGVLASYNSACKEQRKVILVAAALYPCIGCFLPPKTPNGKPCIENLAPSKQKGARIEAIIKECLDSEGPNFSDGFAISQTSLEKFIPQAIEDWLARQDR
ncbi:hypothetical protein M885DRAFT_579175, partial [Pelagophyceae sp. CCMP2097]